MCGDDETTVHEPTERFNLASAERPKPFRLLSAGKLEDDRGGDE
jgi:hypothetical protein